MKSRKIYGNWFHDHQRFSIYKYNLLMVRSEVIYSKELRESLIYINIFYMRLKTNPKESIHISNICRNLLHDDSFTWEVNTNPLQFIRNSQIQDLRIYSIQQRIVNSKVNYTTNLLCGYLLGIEYNRRLQPRTKRTNWLPNMVIAW